MQPTRRGALEGARLVWHRWPGTMQVPTGTYRPLQAVVCVIALAACEWRAEPSAGRPKEQATSRRAAASDLPAGPAFDVSGTRGTAVFWVLGALNEYLGRRTFAGGGEDVETLFCNEDKFVPRFRNMLGRLVREQQLADDLSESTVQGWLVTFHSQALAVRIDQLYRDRRPTGMFANPGRHELVALYVSRDILVTERREHVVAYLAGAYQRFGQGDSIVLANAEHKARLIAEWLAQIGATNVRHETLRETVPNGNVVSFRASPAIRRALSQTDP